MNNDDDTIYYLSDDGQDDETAQAQNIAEDVTRPAPSGFDTYTILARPHGKPYIFTYQDLWMVIVCRSTLDGDWIRARASAEMVTDAANKKAIIERLWALERELNGLPLIPDQVVKLHFHRAHVWFNQRKVEGVR